jgi:hypothetical protein
MRKLPFVLTLLAPLLLVMPARAQDWAWIMSIPYALSQEQIYKVRLLDIDGVPQNELIRYAVGPGKRDRERQDLPAGRAGGHRRAHRSATRPVVLGAVRLPARLRFRGQTKGPAMPGLESYR